VDAFWLMAALAFSSVIVVVFHHPDRDRLGKSAEHVNVKSVNKSISYDR
jgi:hypothetical protein